MITWVILHSYLMSDEVRSLEGAKTGVVGKCLCVVPTVQTRAPEGVVVNQQPLWTSAKTFSFSLLCSVHIQEGQRQYDTGCHWKGNLIIFTAGGGGGGVLHCSLTSHVDFSVDINRSVFLLDLRVSHPHGTTILAETDWPICKQHLQDTQMKLMFCVPVWV